MSDALKKETIEVEEKGDTISHLFEERDRPPLQEDIGLSSNAPQKQAEPPLSSETLENKVETEAAKGDDQAIDSPELKSLQEELTKTNKRLGQTQQYGHKNSKRLKSALKITRDLLESGALSGEEAMSLVESLENDSELDEEVAHTHPFGKVLKIANAELENIRKYTDDNLLDDKVKAFDYFLNLASPEEVKDALEELTDLINDPIKLTKKMLSLGKLYYDESYKDIARAGSVKNYITSKNEEIEKLNRSIDKLTKKLAQYEDYDQPRYRINEMSESGGVTAKDSITALFEERDKVPRRR